MTDAPAVTLADIRAAREALEGVSVYTPMEESRWLSAFAGGPVTPNEVRGLSRSPLFRNDAYRVLSDLVLFGSRDALEQAIAAGATADRLRVYLGYSGWSPGQLERETARGDWHVMAGDSAMVFSPEPEGVWRRLIRLTDVLVG